MTDTYIWTTAAINRETPDAVTVFFDTHGAAFEYSSGQFINITLRINGEPVTRSYSLSSVMEEGGRPAITVKKVPGGLMSSHIVDNGAAISEWQVSGPHGRFILPDNIRPTDHLVLLAGGSGITPLYAIARSFQHRFPDAAVTLLYSSRSGNDIIFRDSLNAWASRKPGKVNIHHALSQHAGDAPPSFIRGRINKLVARKLIKAAVPDPPTAVHYFICGPAELMKMHQEMLLAMQVPEEQIYLEWFEADKAGNDMAPVLPDKPQEVLLHFYEQTNLLEVDPGESILAAALNDRIPLPFSCRTGTCGACVARLTSGKVTMATNYALRKMDLDNGLILLCQSYPLTGDVTIEID
ncbi:ferredoxin--NADP reductase [Chitinophaga sp. 212800010-3]|uniref:ferredoxin--NADP reductase n=1 Tax=unclassified Chitinophaga TaxID=2619133 RepID=UPI002DF28E1C|nr:Ring-1,2-phenylacetyl-CoA epoxidase subunit PaaE [Chitinophaga sp. 212800010-3]